MSMQKKMGTVSLLTFFGSPTVQQRGDTKEPDSRSRVTEQNTSNGGVLVELRGYVMGYDLGENQEAAVRVWVMDLDLGHGVYLARH